MNILPGCCLLTTYIVAATAVDTVLADVALLLLCYCCATSAANAIANASAAAADAGTAAAAVATTAAVVAATAIAVGKPALLPATIYTL